MSARCGRTDDGASLLLGGRDRFSARRLAFGFVCLTARLPGLCRSLLNFASDELLCFRAEVVYSTPRQRLRRPRQRLRRPAGPARPGPRPASTKALVTQR